MSRTAVVTGISTTTASMAAPSLPMTSLRADAGTLSCCPGCGHALPPVDPSQAELLVAQSRIAQLESEVRALNQKASEAVQRWADYEDQLARLRAQQRQYNKPLPEQPQPSPTNTSFFQAGTSRLSSMLAARKPTPAPLQADQQAQAQLPPRPATSHASPSSSAPSAAGAEDELRRALAREQGLRREAEGRLSATSREVEELSVSLFGQANEMVAQERRARAKLEERVEELERRDREKRGRLERLELAMGRIDRVRALLGAKS